MSDIAIRAENLSKKYRIGQREPYRTLRDTLAEAFTKPLRAFRSNGSESASNTIWALQDISLEVKRGEAVGIIGHNGAGKSTFLKILSRVTEPTSGRATIRGQVGSLLEVGTGFNLELTGRENIFLNGAILGMKRRDIERRFDEIVEFSGIESFLDTPVKRYSTGMYMRLAFAVAAHLESDILIVDEVLAVGDAAFQRKCLGKMDDITRSGRTIVFVSHNLAAVEALCQSAYLLQSGRMVMSGSPESVIEHYSRSWIQKVSATVDLTQRPGNERASRPPLFTHLRLLDAEGNEATRFRSGSPIAFELALDSGEIQLDLPLILISIAHRGATICNLDTKTMLTDMPPIHGRKTLRCYWEPGWLSAGAYSVSLGIKSSSNGEMLDSVGGATSFDIEVPDLYGTGKTDAQSILFPKGRWEF